MGATVFDAARVSAKVTTSGEVAYLWEEKAYCIKDGPKNVRWEAMAFGNRNDILRRIYLMAKSIPGGMLKVGGKTPTAFVKAMLKLLDDPLLLETENCMIESSKNGFFSAITNENRLAIKNLAAMKDRPDISVAIDDCEASLRHQIRLNVANDFAVIRAMINDLEYQGTDVNDRSAIVNGISPWEFFRMPQVSPALKFPNLSASNSSSKIEMPNLDLKLYFLPYRDKTYSKDGAPVCVATLNDSLIFVGDLHFEAYHLKATIIQVAGDVHVKSGQYVLDAMMKAVKREMVLQRAIPESAVFYFSCPKQDWHIERFNAVVQLLGRTTATPAELAGLSDHTALNHWLATSWHEGALRIEGLHAEGEPS